MEAFTLDNILAGAAALFETLCPPGQADFFAEMEDHVQVVIPPELNPANSAEYR